jgi:ferredoxin-nitrate reductase
MDDRISDPWGERTPYGPGEEWPVRVDENLPAGEPERWAQAASLLHSNGDAMDIAVSAGSSSSGCSRPTGWTSR